MPWLLAYHMIYNLVCDMWHVHISPYHMTMWYAFGYVVCFLGHVVCFLKTTESFN